MDLKQADCKWLGITMSHLNNYSFLATKKNLVWMLKNIGAGEFLFVRNQDYQFT